MQDEDVTACLLTGTHTTIPRGQCSHKPSVNDLIRVVRALYAPGKEAQQMSMAYDAIDLQNLHDRAGRS
ncbi:MAG: hypothetical protein DPW13_14075 [Planctomycetes bacterium]|nr:hypothetical protein [Planctomycetota bacterium]